MKLHGISTWAVWCLLALAPAKASTLYSVTAVGPTLAVTGINNAGQVVGFTSTGSFLYDGTYHSIANPAGGTFRAEGINDQGQVVGQVNLPSASYAIGLYSGGTVQLLGLGSNTAGYAINNAGEIAGELVYAYRGMTYVNGVITPIGVLPGDGESIARGINQAGDVLVYSAGSAGHPAIYSGGVLSAVAGSAGLDVQPESLNNLGQVVGSFSTTNPALPSEAILFSNGQAIPLGALSGSGTQESLADSINDFGVIAGGTTSGIQARATAYYPGAGLVDLNSVLINGTGWSLQYAEQVNNEGQIAGIGTYNGIQSAFVLDPIATPEPMSFGFAAFGLAAIAAAIRKRVR